MLCAALLFVPPGKQWRGYYVAPNGASVQPHPCVGIATAEAGCVVRVPIVRLFPQHSFFGAPCSCLINETQISWIGFFHFGGGNSRSGLRWPTAISSDKQ